MKKLYALLVIAFIGCVGNAQIVNIPDANFKAKLISLGIDLNTDGNIQETEALAVTNLSVNTSSITNLTGIAYFNNLVYFDCSHNQIQSLDVSSLINLQYLFCDYNQLTTLNVNGLTSLIDLYCEANQLTSIEVNSLTNLMNLDCSDNQLTSLDMSNCIHTGHIICGPNQLTLLFIKNGVNEVVDFLGNPNLLYICADESQIASIQSKLYGQYGYYSCNVNSYCSFTPGGSIFTIQGNTKYDNNHNGCDINDINYPNMKLQFSDGTSTRTFIANTLGAYRYDVLAGTHTVTSVLENPTYFSVSPTTATVSFPSANSPSTQDFCLTANGVHNDLEVFVFPAGNARPGFDAKYKIIYKNKGTGVQSGSLNFAFNDQVLDYVSATPTVNSQTTNNLSWNFSNLSPFETREILVTLNVNSPSETPAVNLGNVLTYIATVTGTTDETPNDNSSTLNQTVTNALDPNDKTCMEGTTVSPSMVGQYVHYVVRFENDGTANAQNIVVKDMIDTTKFDIATLVPLIGSANYTTRIINTNQVEFIFQNINLPFATGTNTGYIAFKIKTKPTLVVGDTFSNSANIYFDYNFPITTNTATTTIAALAIQDFDFGTYFSLYPNPAKQILNLQTKATINLKSITIYNILGQLLTAIPNAESVSSMDVSNLKSGTYFIKINTDKGTANAKFLKE